MQKSVFVFDPTIKDTQSKVRGIGRYMQILRENFSDEFIFTSRIENWKLKTENAVFINPFFNFLQKPLTLKRVAKKQVAIIHDLIPLKYPTHFPIGLKGTIYTTLNKLALRNYDIVITDSLASKKDVVDILRLPASKIKVVYPCLSKIFTNLKFEIRNLNSNSKLKISNYCIYVGDATWNKNLVNLAKAIKKAGVTCVFVGKVFVTSHFEPRRLDKINNGRTATVNPWQKELQEFLILADGDPRFIFKGFVPDEELISLYQNAIFNILPSRDEGFGFSYLEASNCGCPSLLADISVLREISGGAALFTDPQNVDDLHEKIKIMTNDVTLRKEIAQKAKERSGFFTMEQFKKSMEKILL